MFTVCPSQYRLTGDLAARSGASMRQVIDLSDVDHGAFRHITTGQSGHFLSPHYGDQVALWFKGTPHQVTLNKDLALERAEHRLTFAP